MKNKLQRDTIFFSLTQAKLNSKAWQRHKEIGSPIVLKKLYWYRIGIIGNFNQDLKNTYLLTWSTYKNLIHW